MTYPELCPLCSCPIQLLCVDGEPAGTIEDAMDAHILCCHKDQAFP
jgi:hypothetical protein